MKISNAIRNVELVFMNFPDIASEETIESFEIAVAAMKKQEPMKPKVDGEFGLCKRCGYVFNSELISEYCVKYCPNCGQKLDWEE